MTKNCGIFPVEILFLPRWRGRKEGKNKKQKQGKRVARNHEILGMLKAGVSANQIAKEFGLSYAGAKKICAKLKSSGDCHCTPGSGRKRKTSERTDRFIVRQSKIGTPTKKHLAHSLKAQTGVKVSTSTIQRRLRENGIHWRKKTRRSFVSEKNRLKRLAFAREHVHWNLDQWKSVIWSDESPFTLQNNSSQFVWRNDREKNTSRTMQGTVKHQKSINVWGCFSGMACRIFIGLKE